MKNNIFQKTLAWLLPVILILFFICACETDPSSQHVSPEEMDELIEEMMDDGVRRRDRRERSGSSRSSGSSVSFADDDTDDDDIIDDDDDTIDDNTDDDVRFDISLLNQISRLMAQGEYERASELSRGTFPHLSELIEDGNYQAASVMLSRMLVYLSR